MTRKEIIEIASQLHCQGQFNRNAAIRSVFQEEVYWTDKHPYYRYYIMGNCPNDKFVLFYNPCNNNYFMGKIDENNNLVIDSEIQGKASGFNHLYWTYLPKFDKNNVINCNK